MQFIPYADALKIIGDHPFQPTVKHLPIDQCMHLVLAEDLIADRDFPPFDRVTMDGIALRYAAFEAGQRTFKIEAVAPAGTPRTTLAADEGCIEIMTGAMLPEGADTVIRYEDLEIKDGHATVTIDALNHRQNVHFQGMDRKSGSVIVPKGKRLSTTELNIAASVGKAELQVLVPPKAVIVSTGDELVPITETPEAHQIRRSNIYGIQAALAQWGIESTLLHLPDDKDVMRKQLTEVLQDHKLLVLTGGVSKGKFDFLPEILDELGVEKLFHKIQQQPGKPFWFGTRGNDATVFALPGNPVSSFMCTQVYMRHWVATSLGIPVRRVIAQLGTPVTFKPSLTYFLECSVSFSETGQLVATPVVGNGSGDFANLVDADGFIILPPDRTEFAAGEPHPFLFYRESL
ncbi:MAG TPA: molybdopterin molybdenumtransferase MoeA [Cytophagales bacterium]|nr:molybdopterin molybdenumtransferase MoeA [Cytophagales bacterium]